MVKIPRSFGIHDGTFHADEVTAGALMILFDLIDQDKIVRTRDSQLLEQCEYVCDVGGVYNAKTKHFDHHQADYQGDLSGAGMILLYLHSIGKINVNEYQLLNHSMIRGVDAHDIGKAEQIPGLCTYSHVISNFMPIQHDAEPDAIKAAFYEALEFALGHIKRLMERYRYAQSCRESVVDAMKNKEECLIFEKSIPWLELFFELGGVSHPAKFIIMPSGKHWKLRGIPPCCDEKMKVREYLPEEWGGLLEDELKKVTGIKGAVFCHKGRFISIWETRQDAIDAYQLLRRKNDDNI